MDRVDRPLLLVEDNADDEELTLMALRDSGVRNEIHVVRDGAEAIEYLFGSEANPPGSEMLPLVVLLDLKLPKIDGFGVLQRIRESERTRYLPVVVLTSSDADEDIARSYRLGVNSYVRKPIEFSEFARSVKQLGLYWLLLNESNR
jgi:two-component system response regulator